MKKLLALAICAASLAVAKSGCTAPNRAPQRSYSHPVVRPAEPQSNNGAVLQLPEGVVYDAEPWRVSSSGVNRITCRSRFQQEEWLGTWLGLKCIDHRAGEVRHYTRLEGLPGDYIEGVYADRNGVWCSVQHTTKEGQRASICRLHRGEDRWLEVRDLPLTGVQSPLYSLPLPRRTAVFAPAPGGLCYVPTPALVKDPVAFHVYHRAGNRWEDVPWDADFRREHPEAIARAADYDRDGVWLATDTGLLRYRWRDRKWTRYLPGVPVEALRTQGRWVWVATRDAAAAGKSIGEWRLRRMDVQSGQWREFPLPGGPADMAYRGPAEAPVYALEVADAAVWALTGSGSVSGYPGSQPARVTRYNLTTQRWQPPQAPAVVLDELPETVLMECILKQPELLPRVSGDRLPGYLCPAATAPSPALFGPRSSPFGSSGDAGSAWRAEEGRLTHALSGGTVVEEFTPSGLEPPVNPKVYAIMALDGRVVVQTAVGVYSMDDRGQWRRLAMPPGQRYEGEFTFPMVGAEGALWLGLSPGVLRYDPRDETFRVALETDPRACDVLGVAGRKLWLSNGAKGLLRYDLDAPRTPETLRPSLPAGFDAAMSSLEPIRLAGRWVWYAGDAPVSGIDRNLVFGWDPDARKWTAPLYLPVRSFARDVCLEAEGKLFVARGGEAEGAVTAFDLSTGTWHPVTPGLPPEAERGARLGMVGVTPEAIWCLDEVSTLWEFDRRTRVWHRYRAPGPVRSGGVAGRFVVVGGDEGLWVFSTETHRWERHPLSTSAGLRLSYATLGPAAVWMLGEIGKEHFVLRFAPATREWGFWTVPLSENAQPEQLITDGETAWLLARGKAYRLTLSSGRWEDPIARSDPSTVEPEVGLIAPDNDAVWLLLRSGLRSLTGETEPHADPLARYDRATGKVERLAPPGGGNGTALLVEKDALWVGSFGSFYRFDKRTRAWTKLDLPLPAAQPNYYGSDAIVREGRFLWLRSGWVTTRWTERSREEADDIIRAP